MKLSRIMLLCGACTVLPFSAYGMNEGEQDNVEEQNKIVSSAKKQIEKQDVKYNVKAQRAFWSQPSKVIFDKIVTGNYQDTLLLTPEQSDLVQKNPQLLDALLQKHLNSFKTDVNDLLEQTKDDLKKCHYTEVPLGTMFKLLILKPKEGGLSIIDRIPHPYRYLSKDMPDPLLLNCFMNECLYNKYFTLIKKGNNIDEKVSKNVARKYKISSDELGEYECFALTNKINVQKINESIAPEKLVVSYLASLVKEPIASLYFMKSELPKTSPILELEFYAQNGVLPAMNDMALHFLKGKDVPKDEKKAFTLLEKAASQDYPNAQYNLGVCLYGGLGVDKDPAKAKEWWEKSAEKGYKLSINALNKYFKK